MVKHYHHRFHFSYNTSFKRHFLSTVLVLVLIFLMIFFVVHKIAPTTSINLQELSVPDLVLAALSTFYRLLIAYLFSVMFSLPLSLLVTSSPKVERFLLPVIDIIQSVPVLAFFPLIVLFFIKYQLFQGAAIFILFLGMVWNLVFTMIGGLKTIPEDIKQTAKVFGATGYKKLAFITLPAILPYIITGSLLAWGQGWNIVIVAEVLHSYIPGGNSSQDLVGLGSLLVNGAYSGKTSVFIGALTAMVVIIGLLNFFLWQKLIHLTERFKFD